MATTKTPENVQATPVENSAALLGKVKVELAELYGLPIIGTADYFKMEDVDTMSANLREIQLYVNAIVSAHDNLADATGNKRLVGKRGRKSGDAKTPTTVDDVVARLSK